MDTASLLRATADTLPGMVGYVDARHRVGFLNDEFSSWFDLQTQDVADLFGRPLSEVFSRDPFPGLEQLETALQGTETRSEHRLSRRGSKRRDVEAFYRPHKGADGSVLGVVVLLTDITERKRMARELAEQAKTMRRANEELEQFAYVASHDLKAPLRAIENLVGWIEEDLDALLTADTRKNMDLLKSRVQRLESLLDDLLGYSRAGRDDARVEDIDIGRLIADVSSMVDPPAGFMIATEGVMPSMRSAKAPLMQAFQNLIGNALKHHDHPEDGHIWIEVLEDGPMLEFAVADDGPGIPSKYRDRVFGMFQTLKPRDQIEGSGMGLAIVRKLVDRQGGRIWLDDGREKRGVTVRFTWPRNPKDMDDGADSEPTSGR